MATRDDVVRAHWRELLPTAYLLTGDQAAARQLVVRTLVPTRRRPGPHDRDGAVAALVRTHRSRWRVAGRTSIQGDPAVPWWASPADVAAAQQLAHHLDGLDRDGRTAVVLRWFEGWTPERIAEQVPGADPAAAARRLPVDPQDLGRRLDGLAGLCDAGSLDDDAVAAAVRDTVSRRRGRAALALTAVAAVAAVGVWVPTVVPPPVDHSGTTAARTTAAVPPRGIYAIPPRGALAGDDELLRELQERLTAEGTSGEDYRLLYGADLAASRVVLMVRAGGIRNQLAWLTGPSGAEPGALEVTSSEESRPDVPALAAAVPDPAGGGVEVVVVTQEDSEVSVSPGVDVDPTTGVAGRTYVDVPTTGGVGTVTLDRPGTSGVRVLVGDQDQVVDVFPASPGMSFPFPDPSGPPVPSRSGDPTASFSAHDLAVAIITGATGWNEEDLDVVVLGAGTTPVAGGAAEFVSVAAVLPNGAVVTTTATGYQLTGPDGSWTSSWGGCGSTGYPAGTDPATLVVAAVCLDSEVASTGFHRTVVIAAPPGHQVELQTAGGGTAAAPELVNGFGTSTDLPALDPVTVTDGGTVVVVTGADQDVLRY